MANKKISELSTRTPSLSDLMLVGDPSSGYSYKCTITSLATIIETDIADGYVTLSTAQTISGAKTFSNNLTLTSVSNAGVDTDKFLVLNGSNVVNFRTGSEVLSDIGGQGALTLTTTGTSGAATLVGNTLNIPQYQAVLTNPVTGTGTTNYIPKFTGTSAIGNSIMYEGTFAIGIGTITPFGGSSNYTALDLRGTVGSIIALGNTSNSITGRFLELSATSSNAQIFSLNSAPLSFGTESLSRLSIDTSGNVTISVIANATTDTDKFLVSDSGVIKYRTGAEVLSDIGAAASTSISGTTNYIPKFTSSSAIGNSIVQDNGATVTIGGSFTLSASSGFPTVGLLNRSSDASLYMVSAASGFILLDNSQNTMYQATPTAHNWNISNAQKMTLDASGNLGLGVTPSAWVAGAGRTAAQIGVTSVSTNVGNDAFFGTNYYDDGTNNKYINSDFSLIYAQQGGEHRWYNAPSGTAGNSITFTQAMTLDASGNLGVGTTNPDNKLTVWGSNNSLTSSQGNINVYTTETAAVDVGGSLGLGGYYNGTSLYIPFANITGKKENSTAGNAAGYLAFLTRDNATGTGERMRITSGGNVGIGTTNPTTALNIVSAVNANIGNVSITSSDNDASGISLKVRSSPSDPTNSRSWMIHNNYSAAGTLEFLSSTTATGNPTTPRMTILGSGNVGIGTTSPNSQSILELAFNQNLSTLGESRRLILNDLRGGVNERTEIGFGYVGATTQPAVIGYQTTDATASTKGILYFATRDVTTNTAPTERMRITSGGNVLIGTTSNSGVDKVRVNNDGTTSYSTVNITNANSTATMYVGVGGSAVANTPLQNNAYVWNGGASALVLGTSNTERMIITSGGNVGIGTTNPNAPLSLSGSADVGMRIKAGASALSYIDFDEADSGTPNGSIAYNHGTNAMTFATGGSNGEKMRITSGGNVGIGSSSPLAITNFTTLTINGTNSSLIEMQAGGTSYARIQASSTEMSLLARGNTPMVFYTNPGSDTERMRITSGGDVQIATGSIQTGDPSGGTKKPWKLGAATVTSVSHYGYAQVEIDGVAYYVGLVTAN